MEIVCSGWRIKDFTTYVILTSLVLACCERERTASGKASRPERSKIEKTPTAFSKRTTRNVNKRNDFDENRLNDLNGKGRKSLRANPTSEGRKSNRNSHCSGENLSHQKNSVRNSADNPREEAPQSLGTRASPPSKPRKESVWASSSDLIPPENLRWSPPVMKPAPAKPQARFPRPAAARQ